MKLTKYFILFLFILPFTYAIGISPASQTMLYEPGESFTFSNRILNNRDVPIDVTIIPTGELGPYIDLTVNETTIDPNSGMRFKYTITHPFNLTPGERTGFVEIHDNTLRGGGMFGVKVVVKHRTIVKVPYPGKYALLDIEVPDINLGELIQFNVNVENMGTEDLSDTSLVVVLKDHQGEVLKEKRFKQISIKTKAVHKVKDYFSSNDLTKGIYYIEAVYDFGKIINESERFFIGSFDIDIVKYDSKIYYEQISPYNVQVLSNWNGEIEDVYIEVEINNKTYPSPSKVIRPLGGMNFISYIDDKSLALDQTYDTKITVYYGESQKSKNVNVTVVEYKGQKLEQPKKPDTSLISLVTSSTGYLILIIIILVLFNLSLVYKKKPKKKKK